VPERAGDGADQAPEHGARGGGPVQAGQPEADDQLARARAALAAARVAAGPRTTGRGSRAGGTWVGRNQPSAPETANAAAGTGEPVEGQPGPAHGGSVESGSGQSGSGQSGSGRPASPRAGRRERRDDPQALSTAIDSLLETEGWSLAAATGSVFGRWPQIVGADLAGHTQPDSLRDGELTVLADSTAWATQLRLLQAQLIRRLNAELGAGTVLRVKVRGPVTATRKPGEWRVRGSRGPGDTYG
jgi:predicted nucleic acid-binding Zn ribbon protein